METKYTSVLKTLLDEIRAGKYRDSEFPSENMSARRFAVGRKTVIKVYDELARRGLVTRRRGSRTVLTHKADREFGRIGLITTLAQLGRRVPEDIQVAGFDDVNYATISAPALTTAHQPCNELADLAFEMLMARIDRPDAPPRQTFLDALLVVRESAKVVRKSHA